MELNDDPSDSDVQSYGGTSIIWRRKTRFFFFFTDPAYNYNLVQIVDGSGDLIEPAYGDFETTVKNEFGNQLFFYGLKSDRIDDYSCA